VPFWPYCPISSVLTSWYWPLYPSFDGAWQMDPYLKSDLIWSNQLFLRQSSWTSQREGWFVPHVSKVNIPPDSPATASGLFTWSWSVLELHPARYFSFRRPIFDVHRKETPCFYIHQSQFTPLGFYCYCGSSSVTQGFDFVGNKTCIYGPRFQQFLARSALHFWISMPCDPWSQDSWWRWVSVFYWTK